MPHQFAFENRAKLMLAFLLVFSGWVGTDAANGQRRNRLPERVPASADSFSDEEAKAIAALYDRKIFSTKAYEDLSRIFAQRFQRRFQNQIDSAWTSETREWMDQHPEKKVRLLTAIESELDDVTKALSIIQQLRQEFPEQVLEYWNLAIAVAVTWDQPRNLYLYEHHSKRAKSKLPDDLSDAIGNFRYFVERESVLKNYGQLLPWEYLVHVVNHKTPSDERDWALANYAAKRVQFGKCYSQVPYDYTMLNSKSAQAKLNGHDYTLANLKTFGGVCAHQADFASRVGKSLGIPAEYVTGQSSFGSSHAWVMWVELKSVSKNRIVFSLESHGRYRGDKYYVGNLKDPQTGRQITDRLLELRLHTLGSNQTAKRHAELLVDCHGILARKNSFSVDDTFAYWMEVVDTCPGNELAWKGVASLAGNPEFNQKGRSKMTRVLTRFFRTFAKMPDFTWTIFDDLIAYETDIKKRIKLYGQLVKVYHKAQRPDLACKAQIAMSKLQVESRKQRDAIEGLAVSILLFADDGRSVPLMLDEIDAICASDEKLNAQLSAFYHKFLPRVPTKRGSRPSKHCKKMYERGIQTFRRLGDEKSAQFYQAKLNQLGS